jgi:hypothetical protein
MWGGHWTKNQTCQGLNDTAIIPCNRSGLSLLLPFLVWQSGSIRPDGSAQFEIGKCVFLLNHLEIRHSAFRQLRLAQHQSMKANSSKKESKRS